MSGNFYEIRDVEVLPDYRLRVSFQNGGTRIADVKAMRGDSPLWDQVFENFSAVENRGFDVAWPVMFPSGPNTLEIEDRDLWGAGKSSRSTVYTLVSDTHGKQRKIDVPPGDILIHCGDWNAPKESSSSLADLNAWLGSLPHARKLLVPGNWEFDLEADPRRRELLTNATVLIDEAVEVDGLKFYGSPTTPLYGGAFGKSNPADRRRHWAKVPQDTQILICHGPPCGILDRPPGQEERQGDSELLQRCQELPDLRIVCFGHIHGAYGMVERDGILFVNATLMGVAGEIEYEPVVLQMDDRRGKSQTAG